MFIIEKYLYVSGPIQFKSTSFKGKPYLSKTKLNTQEIWIIYRKESLK